MCVMHTPPLPPPPFPAKLPAIAYKEPCGSSEWHLVLKFSQCKEGVTGVCVVLVVGGGAVEG